jgi:hypothetical protein
MPTRPVSGRVGAFSGAARRRVMRICTYEWHFG